MQRFVLPLLILLGLPLVACNEANKSPEVKPQISEHWRKSNPETIARAEARAKALAESNVSRKNYKATFMEACLKYPTNMWLKDKGEPYCKCSYKAIMSGLSKSEKDWAFVQAASGVGLDIETLIDVTKFDQKAMSKGLMAASRGRNCPRHTR